jgi:putative ABC transport system permease protein
MYDNMYRTALIILEQAFLGFPLVLGAYCSISLMKIPDLSLESAYVFGAILASQCLFLTNNLPTPITFICVLLAALIGGMTVGTVSGLLTQKAKLPHLLSAIITTGIFHGANQFVLGTCNMSISRYKNLLGYIAYFRQNPELPSLAISFVVLLIIAYLFLKTQLGYALAVLGNNRSFFEHYGISTQYVFIIGVLIANGLAGLGGYFDATSGGFTDINMGVVKALFCVIALILGKTFVRTKKPFSIWIPVVGVMSYFTLQQLLLKVGFNLKYFTMIHSIIVLIFLINVLKKKTGKIDHLGV